MAEASLNASRPWRWFRFSLRTFLLLVTVACVALGLYAKKQRDRNEAIVAIKRCGGIVRFGEGPNPKNRVAEDERTVAIMSAAASGQPRPEFAEELPNEYIWQRLFGKYCGGDVLEVDLSRTVFARADAGFDTAKLAPLTEIKRLVLCDDKAVNELLEHLPPLPNLETLTLQLIRTDTISDKGLECLARLPNLRFLRIQNGRISREGLAQISAAKKLKSLDLYKCQFPEDGLRELSSLANLTHVSLVASTVSDEGLVPISELHNLKALRIEGGYVTWEGMKRLRAALPNCHIEPLFGSW